MPVLPKLCRFGSRVLQKTLVPLSLGGFPTVLENAPKRKPRNDALLQFLPAFFEVMQYWLVILVRRSLRNA